MVRTIKQLEETVMTKEVIKHASRVLKNYLSFRKLASLSDKPFSNHGQNLADEIDRVINGLPELEKSILINRYQTKAKDRKTVKAFCVLYGITSQEYQEANKRALLEFARGYRQGALLNCLEV